MEHGHVSGDVCVCMYVYACVYSRLCVCVYLHTYAYIHTYTHACIPQISFLCQGVTPDVATRAAGAAYHAYIHTYIHTYTHTYTHAYIHTYTHACIPQIAFLCQGVTPDVATRAAGAAYQVLLKAEAPGKAVEHAMRVHQNASCECSIYVYIYVCVYV